MANVAQMPGSPLSSRSILIERMEQKLAHSLYTANGPNGSFWCESDLQQAWKEEYVEELLGFEDRKDLETAQTNFYKILTVLIHIKKLDRDKFEALFLRPGWNDESLPFGKNWLRQKLGEEAGHAFHKHQWKCIPILVKDMEHAHIQGVDPSMIWPFETPT